MHLRTTLLATLLSAALAGCIPAPPPPAGMPPTTRVVTYDMGGSFGERLRSIERLRAAQTPVAITGRCASACTLLLALETTCVTPDAVLMFHGPQKREDNGDIVDLSPDDMERHSRHIASHYPPPLRAWFWDHAAHLTGRDTASLTGAQVVAMGARACPTDHARS